MLDVLNINKYIKDNNLIEVKDPISFINQEPNPSGLYSPLIFGTRKQEKFEKYAYINLGLKIIHPVIYKNLKKIKSIFYNITLDNDNGKKAIIRNNELIEDKNGESGINFLINNWDKIDLNLYKTGKNDNFIDMLIKERDNLFIDKFLVIPVNYRQYTIENGRVNEDTITGYYKGILSIVNANRNIETNDFLQNLIKIGGGKTLSIQNKINEIYEYFINLEDSKTGIIRSKVLSKRIDNITRLVANAQPNIPMDCCAIPWQNLLVMFDLFVIRILKDKTDEDRKKLGVNEFTLEDFGSHFDFIFRHSDNYTLKYPERVTLWQEILKEVFDNFPNLRVLLKRDPAWNRDSYHCLKPIIIKDTSYHCVVNSLLYKPLGGDSFKTNYIGDVVEGPIFENDKMIISGDKNISIKITKIKDFVNKYGGVKWELN